ncbi:MAG: Ig-like domain-containing protein, partial [Actinomycetota bacterium]
MRRVDEDGAGSAGVTGVVITRMRRGAGLLSACAILAALLAPAPARAGHSVTCRAALPVHPGEPMTWRAFVSGASDMARFAWSGSDGLTGSGPEVTFRYAAIGYKTARVTVTDGGHDAVADCAMHVVPSSFSEPPSVTPVLWVPRDVDPAPILPQLERAWRQIQVVFFDFYGKTFRSAPFTTVVSPSTEAEICGGDCTDFGLAGLLMDRAWSESDAVVHTLPYTRAMLVMAWGTGGFAGSFGWDIARGGVGEYGFASAVGVPVPPIEPDLPQFVAEGLGVYDVAIYTIAHELNHLIAWDDPHDFALENPPNDYEKAVALAGPFLTETPSDATKPSVSISRPAVGAVLSGTRPVVVDATDDVGVEAVTLLVDGQVWAVDEASPYSIDLDTTLIGHGKFLLTAIAQDSTGNTATVARQVTVENRLAEASCGEDFPEGTFHVCYYEGTGFEGPYLGTLLDHPFPVPAPNAGWLIRHDWGSDPVAFGRGDDMSGVWRGRLTFPPGRYLFRLWADEGARVFVDGALVIDHWQDIPQQLVTEVTLAGPTELRIEWNDVQFGQQLKLFWQPTRPPAPPPAGDRCPGYEGDPRP